MKKKALSILDIISKFITNKNWRIRYLDKLGFYKKMPDDLYLTKMFKVYIGKDLNLSEPKTFNEKLQWLKLHDRKLRYTSMVDKAEVKKYVKKQIGEEYIIPTLGVWDTFEEIDFERLPKQFVMKCTHDSGGLVICRDKETFDKRAAKLKLEKFLKRDYYLTHREWPYKNVKRRIIVEKYIEDSQLGSLRDYKLMCFNGKVKCSFVVTERFTEEGIKVTFFDEEWNVMPFERHYPKSGERISKPEKYDLMVELAEKLSDGIPFVRVDFYEVKGKVYFGEMTFYPGSGFEEFEPYEWDEKLGDWIDLTNVKENNYNGNINS